MAEQRMSFRSAILPCAVATAVAAFVTGSAFVLLVADPLDTWSDWLPLLWAVPAAAGVVLLAVPLMRVFVSADGLSCYTFWGRYYTVPWSQVEAARPINVGLRYLRVRSAQGFVLWVPLFLADMSRFRAAVVEAAGEGHVLSRALR